MIQPLAAAVIFGADVFDDRWFTISDLDVLWSKVCAGSLLFRICMVRKPADMREVTEIKGSGSPHVLQLSSPLSRRLKNILLSSEEEMHDFSGRRIS